MAVRLRCEVSHDVLKIVYDNCLTISPVKVFLREDGMVKAVKTDDIIMFISRKCGVKKGGLTGVWQIDKPKRIII